MANMFNQPKTKSEKKTVKTHEGGNGALRTVELELALLTVSNYLEDTFYVKAEDRVKRMQELVDKANPDFVNRLAVVARKEFNNRTTPVALLAMQTLQKRELPDVVINGVFVRGDEVLTYLGAVKALSRKKIVTPQAKKVGNRVLNTLTQRKAMRYMGGSKNWNLSDAIRVVHPTGIDEERSALFAFIVAAKREGSATAGWEALTEVQRSRLKFVEKSINGSVEEQSDTSWEKARSAGASWQTVVDGMGYMALLRNLRNFLQDVSASETEFWDKVVSRLRDRNEVARSKQMTYRMLSAYKAIEAASSNRKVTQVRSALEDAMEYSIDNIPELTGKTLVLIDTSASMTSAAMSDKSGVSCADVAACLGIAAARRFNADVVEFASTAAIYKVDPNKSVLANIKDFTSRSGRVGHGTTLEYVPRVVKISDYDNVIVFSDMQMAESRWGGDSIVTSSLKGVKGKVFSVDLAGYEAGFQLTNNPKVVSIGGFSDATLRLISMSTGKGIVDYIKNYEIAQPVKPA